MVRALLYVLVDILSYIIYYDCAVLTLAQARYHYYVIIITEILFEISNGGPVPFKCPLPWCHQQMGTFSALLALCAWNLPVSGEFPSQRPVTRRFHVFFSKQSIVKVGDLKCHRSHYDVIVMRNAFLSNSCKIIYLENEHRRIDIITNIKYAVFFLDQRHTCECIYINICGANCETITHIECWEWLCFVLFLLFCFVSFFFSVFFSECTYTCQNKFTRKQGIMFDIWYTTFDMRFDECVIL